MGLSFCASADTDALAVTTAWGQYAGKLKINYRTTAEILAWSLGLLRGERIDDMNGGLDSIAGCRSEQ